MDLILIACCGEKSPGGSPEYSGSHVQSYLSASAHLRLSTWWKALANIKGLPLGPDLGEPQPHPAILFKPAYLRYTGKVYQRSNFPLLYPHVKNKKVLIISAFYGMVDAGDPIRDYDMKMDETLSTGRWLSTWWKKIGLGRMVEEYILSLKPERVYDLLSNSYRSALAAWPPASLKKNRVIYIPYSYPGEGTGSLWHRGDDLKKLLLE